MWKLLNKKIYTFVLIGSANTLLDFTIFASLISVGIGIFVANFISTFIALLFSFALNSRYTFRYKGKDKSRKFTIFLLFTLIGLWIIQPLIIKFVLYSENVTGLTNLFNDFSIFSIKATILFAKGVAIVGSMIWNFVWYNSVVFSNKEIINDEDI